MKRLAAALLPVAVVLDQWTKHWADAHVQGRGVITLLPGVFDLRYARNPGAFFSLGDGLDPSVRRPLFLLVTGAVLWLLGRAFVRAEPGQDRLRFALALLAGGALGNLVDRVRSGEVVDFMHLHAGALLHWATFNFADVWISAGLLLLALDLLRPRSLSTRDAHGPRPAQLDGGL